MANILDYLDWRGDISMRTVPYNEADELVLCRLAYLPFEKVIEETMRRYTAMTLQEAVRRVRRHCEKGRTLLQPEDSSLLEKLETSARFAPLRLCGYVNRLDAQQEKQFAAITVFLPDHTVAVVYRGTDNTLVGWKEDFNMSFAATIPAQRDAVAYLHTAAEKFRQAKLRICGHSKGGNLAVFAAAFCGARLQERILCVRNYDGPGFLDAVLQTNGYRSIMARTSTYLPQSSVFGMLLEHSECYTVVQSAGNLLTQHDLYSWQVTRSGPVLVEELSERSVFLDAALKDWLAAMEPERREQVVDGLFGILQDAGIERLEDLAGGKKSVALLKSVLRLDENTRKVLTSALRILTASVRKTLRAQEEEKRAKPPRTPQPVHS